MEALIVCVWLLSGVAATGIGWQRNWGPTAFILGPFLGPLGLVIVLVTDLRHQCPDCLGRLPGMANCCMHCGCRLKWTPNAAAPAYDPKPVVDSAGARVPDVPRSSPKAPPLR